MRNLTTLMVLGMLCSLPVFSQSIQLIPVTPNVPWLIGAEHAGDQRLFLVRQDGYIVIRTPDGAVSPTPFLDWSSKIKLNGEQGLLGLAFHPDYANNGYFFIYYSEAGTGNSVLSRLSRSAANPEMADPATEMVMLTFPHPSPNHVGGSLKFGDDGYLYLSSGDGGEYFDPNGNGQNNHLYLGKILRFDVDNGSPFIPADNPFIGNPAYLPAIWCTGLRNPWRMSFDRLTGDAWIGDVGQSTREEVNVVPAGEGGFNFGWSCMEGTLGFNACPDSLCCFVPPVFEYGHNTNPSCSGSITGGYVYRGYRWNDLWGKYVFTDFCTGEIWTLQRPAGVAQVTSLGTFNPFDYVNISEDPAGELYISGYFSNKLYRIESLNCAPVAQIVGMPDNIMRCATDTTAITLAAYGAGVSGMNFQWMKNGAPLENETGGSFTVNTITQNSLFTVVVTNPENGCSATSNAISVLALPNAYSQVDTTLAPGTVLHGVAIAHDTTFITELPASNGCDSTIFYTVHLLSGSSQLQQDQFQFRASPNPAQSVVILDLSLPTAAPEATICLFNQVGKMVQKTVYNDLPAGKNQRQLTLNGLPPGIYAIRVQIGWQTSTRIVVHS